MQMIKVCFERSIEIKNRLFKQITTSLREMKDKLLEIMEAAIFSFYKGKH